MSGGISSDSRGNNRAAEVPQGSLVVPSAAVATTALTGVHDILEDVDHRVLLSSLPDAFSSVIQAAEGLSDDAEIAVYLYPKQLSDAGCILIPSHGWDYSERVHPEEVFNLRKTGELSVMAGPTVNSYSKVDPSQPAYIMFQYLSSDAQYRVLKID